MQDRTGAGGGGSLALKPFLSLSLSPIRSRATATVAKRVPDPALSRLWNNAVVLYTISRLSLSAIPLYIIISALSTVCVQYHPPSATKLKAHTTQSELVYIIIILSSSSFKILVDSQINVII